MSLRRFALLAALMTAVVGASCRKTAAVDAITLDSSLIASLERGPCRGSCPVYKVEVFGDGRVRFDGKQHVGTLGVKTGTTTTTAIQDFMRSVSASEFASADTSYVMGSAKCGQYYTDLPMAALSIKVGGRMKTVQHDPGCQGAPKFLGILEFQLDTTARTASWIAGNGDKK